MKNLYQTAFVARYSMYFNFTEITKKHDELYSLSLSLLLPWRRPLIGLYSVGPVVQLMVAMCAPPPPPPPAAPGAWAAPAHCCVVTQVVLCRC